MALGCVLAVASFPRIDLDVAVPPGSALEWTRVFPVIEARRGPLFPGEAAGTAGTGGGLETRTAPAADELDVRVPDSFGLMRILTWDLANELEWVRGAWPELAHPRTGALAVELPAPSEPFYWVSLAPLLRRLLHPALVSEPELTVHVLELGEPLLPLLEAAREEPALSAFCADALRRLVPRSSGHREPIRYEEPEEDLLSRFVYERLLAAHPYDPDAGFGAWIFLLGDLLEPYVQAYAHHAEAFLRRNAVAALARYDTPSAATALLEIALDTEDPVVFVRALSGLARQRAPVDTTALLARFEESDDPVERAALAGLFAARSTPGAAEAIRRAAREVRDRDVDLLTTYLWALCRLPGGTSTRLTRQDQDFERFLRELAHAADRDPMEFAEPQPESFPAGGVADPRGTRGLLVHQLAVLARARIDPEDGGVRREVRGLPDHRPRAMKGAAAAGPRLGVLLPPAQPSWLDALGRDPRKGHPLLREWVSDRSLETRLRMRALALLPRDERDALAEKILADAEERSEAHTFALELLDADRSPRLERAARAVLARFAGAVAGGGAPADRELYRLAIRALDERGLSTAEELLPLARHLLPPEDGKAPAVAVRARALELALVAIRRARERKGEAERDAAIEELVDFVLHSGVNREFDESMRDVVVSHVRLTLTDLERRMTDEAERELADGLVTWLFEWRMPDMGQRNTVIRPPIPLEETLLVALAHTADPRAMELLRRLAGEERFPKRAVACLALGIAGDRDAIETLADSLRGDDAFVRICAWLAARRITGEDHFADWLDGEPERWAAAAERYLDWGRAHR